MTKRSVLANLGLLGISLLSIAIVGELGIRALMALGFIAEPGGSIIFPDVPYMARFVPSEDELLHLELDRDDTEINRSGFRDREFSSERGAGVRIVALGDSVTYGRGIPLEQTWPKLLEASLNADSRGSRYEVLNMGVSGYNTRQEVRWYEKYGRAFRPDIIVLQYTLNDIFPAGAHLAFLAAESQKRTDASAPTPATASTARAPQASWRQRLPESRFLGFLDDRFRELLRGREVAAPGWTVFYDRPNTWTSVRRSLQRLSAIAKRDGASVRVVIFPELVDFDAYPYTEIHRKVAAEAGRRGFPVLDLLPVLSTRDAESLRLTPADTTHLNADALRISAAAIETFLRETGSQAGSQPH